MSKLYHYNFSQTTCSQEKRISSKKLTPVKNPKFSTEYKKILFISPLPPPHYGSAMSSEMCLEILKKSKNIEVRNIKTNYSKELNDIGKPSISKLKGFLYVKSQIRKEILNFNPDIVYFMPTLARIGLIRDYFFVMQVKKYYKKKIIFHVRERVQERDWNRFKKIFSKIFKNSKAIILDKNLKVDLHNLVSNKDIFVLPNAIENTVSGKKIANMIKSRRKNKKIDILFLSNMDQTKGWPKLLLACKILQNKKLNFECNFVGEWPSQKEKKLFEKIVKNNNLAPKVNYLGKKIGKEKDRILARSNILAFPTEYPPETFGRVNIEAMMFALPVVANGIAAIPSIIEHKKTGFILKENSPEEIADYLEKLIENQKLREKMGKAGRKKFLKEFEIKNYEKKFLRILNLA